MGISGQQPGAWGASASSLRSGEGGEGVLQSREHVARDPLSQRALGQVRGNLTGCTGPLRGREPEKPSTSAAQMGDALLSPRRAGDGGGGGHETRAGPDVGSHLLVAQLPGEKLHVATRSGVRNLPRSSESSKSSLPRPTPS